MLLYDIQEKREKMETVKAIELSFKLITELHMQGKCTVNQDLTLFSLKSSEGTINISLYPTTNKAVFNYTTDLQDVVVRGIIGYLQDEGLTVFCNPEEPPNRLRNMLEQALGTEVEEVILPTQMKDVGPKH